MQNSNAAPSELNCTCNSIIIHVPADNKYNRCFLTGVNNSRGSNIITGVSTKVTRVYNNHAFLHTRNIVSQLIVCHSWTVACTCMAWPMLSILKSTVSVVIKYIHVDAFWSKLRCPVIALGTLPYAVSHIPTCQF